MSSTTELIKEIKQYFEDELVKQNDATTKFSNDVINLAYQKISDNLQDIIQNELNAIIGKALTELEEATFGDICADLEKIQNELFDGGGDLANVMKERHYKLADEPITEMEERIDVLMTEAPEDLNPNGTLFGGSLLRWIDEEAAIYAIVQLGNQNVVTKLISEVNFVSSAKQSDIIELGITATAFGRTSITMRCVVRNKITHKLFLSLNFNTGYRGRASDLTVPGLGHSVIRGLVTYRSMVRRESCRLLA